MVRIEIRERPLYEVANTYNMNSMELLRVARDELKLSVKSHMSVLSGQDYEILIKFLDDQKKKTTATIKKVATKTRKASVRRRTTPAAKLKTAEPEKGTKANAAIATLQEDEAKPKLTRKTIVRKATEKAKPVETVPEKISEVEPPSQKVTAPEETAEKPVEKTSRLGAVVISKPDPEAIRRAMLEKRQREEKRALPQQPSPETTKPRKQHGYQKVEEETKAKPSTLVQKTEVFHPVDYLKREHTYRTKRKRVRTSGPSTSTTKVTTPAAHKRVIEFIERITVKELARKMNIKVKDLLNKLDSLGLEEIEQTTKLDCDTAILVAPEFGFEVQDCTFTEERFFKLLEERVKDPGLKLRAPVVTVMGHVDHGKTTILDAIRKTQVTKQESGGITQHIGAYQVTYNNKNITFLDTPGHAAFTAMRKRGADVTDIVVLVVAADDAVMPQTREAISHAKAAGVPMIIAVNKMDTQGANPDKVKNQLSELEILSEEWGGDHIFVPMSALKGEGVEDLLNAILLVSEVAELKASFNLHPSAIVVESKLDRFRGPLATVIVKQGVFKTGGLCIAETTTGRIRQLNDDNGSPVEEAVPGMPVEIAGMDGVIQAGVRIDVLPKDEDVKALLNYRKEQLLKSQVEKVISATPTIEELMDQVGDEPSETKVFNVIIKADVKGSEEALKHSIEALANEEAEVNIVYSGSGTLTESDLDLVNTTGSVLLIFNVPIPSPMRKILERSKIRYFESKVIYELIENFERLMQAEREPEYMDEDLGEVEVRQIFKITKAGLVAGCYVKSGKVLRNCMVRVNRDGEEIGIGKIASLKRFKDDVKEVIGGYECGMTLEWSEDTLQEGDILKVYHKVEKPFTPIKTGHSTDSKQNK